MDTTSLFSGLQAAALAFNAFGPVAGAVAGVVVGIVSAVIRYRIKERNANKAAK